MPDYKAKEHVISKRWPISHSLITLLKRGAGRLRSRMRIRVQVVKNFMRSKNPNYLLQPLNTQKMIYGKPKEKMLDYIKYMNIDHVNPRMQVEKMPPGTINQLASRLKGGVPTANCIKLPTKSPLGIGYCSKVGSFWVHGSYFHSSIQIH